MIKFVEAWLPRKVNTILHVFLVCPACPVCPTKRAAVHPANIPRQGWFFSWHCEQNRAQTLLDINTTGGERNALPLLIHALPFTPTEPLVKTEQVMQHYCGILHCRGEKTLANSEFCKAMLGRQQFNEGGKLELRWFRVPSFSSRHHCHVCFREKNIARKCE